MERGRVAGQSGPMRAYRDARSQERDSESHGEQQNKLSAEKWKKIAQAAEKFNRGTRFVGLLPKEAEWHYAGKRVTRGAADTPIFWYRPKDAKKYRVIYADLTVCEADVPPKVAEVLPEQDLIDAFHEYAKETDGVLPDSLDLGEWAMGYSKKMTRQLFLAYAPRRMGSWTRRNVARSRNSFIKLRFCRSPIRRSKRRTRNKRGQAKR